MINIKTNACAHLPTCRYVHFSCQDPANQDLSRV